MSRIRGRDTTPEKIVRSLLRGMRLRFRLNARIEVRRAKDEVRTRPARRPLRPSTINSQPSTIFVRPDIVLPQYKIAIFVHGCFWHRHRGCRNCTTPTHRRAWWVKKLEGNAARDKVHQRALRRLGWRSIVVWECETEGAPRLERRLARLLCRRERPLRRS